MRNRLRSGRANSLRATSLSGHVALRPGLTQAGALSGRVSLASGRQARSLSGQVALWPSLFGPGLFGPGLSRVRALRAAALSAADVALTGRVSWQAPAVGGGAETRRPRIGRVCGACLLGPPVAVRPAHHPIACPARPTLPPSPCAAGVADAVGHKPPGGRSPGAPRTEPANRLKARLPWTGPGARSPACVQREAARGRVPPIAGGSRIRSRREAAAQIPRRARPAPGAARAGDGRAAWRGRRPRPQPGRSADARAISGRGRTSR